jgi:hypothetical protein
MRLWTIAKTVIGYKLLKRLLAGPEDQRRRRR